MATGRSRRAFLETAAGSGVLLGMSGLFGRSADAGSDSQASKAPIEPRLEPIVRLLEDTPRDRLLEEVAARIQAGTSYRDVLSALLLAGVRNIEPRPSVGFKFHAVLAVNSVHLAAIASPEADRWLPIFWALDYFKDSQARDERERGWAMRPVREAAMPAPDKARQALADAMDRWDAEAADAAVAQLARSASAAEVFEMLHRYGARDFRSIGHKAIFVANAQRTLAFVDRPKAEPVLRSIAYALLQHEDGSPADRDDPADRPGRRNLEQAGRFRTDWLEGQASSAATEDLLAALREGSADAASDKVVDLVHRRIAPQSIWDAVFCGAGELLMRQPGIVALHAVTTTNALHYSYQSCRDDATRRYLLLQNASLLPMFRDAMSGRGTVRELRIDAWEPIEPKDAGEQAVEEIFADVDRDRMAAARKALAWLQSGGDARRLVDAARRLVVFKGDGAHDYKFASAVLEDHAAVSAAWRDRYLAASMFSLRGSGKPDHALVARTRAALKG